MFCENCGSKIPEGSKFCVVCGTKVAAKKKTGRILVGVILVVCIVLIIVVAAGSGSGSAGKPASQAHAATAETAAPEPTVPVTTVPATTAPPADGWSSDDGARCYYKNGKKLTGLQTIDGGMFYFNADGSLAVSTTVTHNGLNYEAGSNGKIVAIIHPVIDGEWSAEKFSYGNGGRCAIKELETAVTGCTHTGFYIEANGQYGAKVNGGWKIYVRSHGNWICVANVDFVEPSGGFDIQFDSPTDFDAIAAHPTVQGNASYSSYFALYDVRMLCS